GVDRARGRDPAARGTPLRMRVRWRMSAGLGLLRKWGWGQLFAEAGHAAGALAEPNRLRSGLEPLDADGIRAMLVEQRTLRRGTAPNAYAQWFSTEPVRDPRLFVANREVLSRLVEVERAWQSNPSAGNAVLVLGGSGTGKSSTLS